MISIVASSSRSNDVFFQYARTPSGKSPSAADCQAVQVIGWISSSSGGGRLPQGLDDPLALRAIRRPPRPSPGA